MDRVRVTNEGLETLAAQHAAISGELVGAGPTAPTGPPAQATSAAVTDGYGAIQAAAGVLAARVEATGTKLATAGINFATADEASGQQIAAVGDAIAF